LNKSTRWHTKYNPDGSLTLYAGADPKTMVVEAGYDEAVFAVRYMGSICSTTGNAWPLSGGLGRRIRSDRLERRQRQPNRGKRVYTRV
jgi:hypothetical protein